jgi:hypothetical protein
MQRTQHEHHHRHIHTPLLYGLREHISTQVPHTGMYTPTWRSRIQRVTLHELHSVCAVVTPNDAKVRILVVCEKRKHSIPSTASNLENGLGPGVWESAEHKRRKLPQQPFAVPKKVLVVLLIEVVPVVGWPGIELGAVFVRDGGSVLACEGGSDGIGGGLITWLRDMVPCILGEDGGFVG